MPEASTTSLAAEVRAVTLQKAHVGESWHLEQWEQLVRDDTDDGEDTCAAASGGAVLAGDDAMLV